MTHYSLLLEHAPQTQWTDRKFILEMTCGAVGGGLFLAGAVTGSGWACLVGLLVAGAAKGLLLLKDLGRPERFLKVMLRPFSSWLSFGGWSLLFFSGFGFLHTVPLLAGAGTGSGWALAVKALAMVFAVVIITYDGLLLAASRAVSAWSSGLLAPLFAASALASGSALVMPAGGAERVMVTFSLLAAEAVLLFCHLAVLKGGATGARVSLGILLAGEQRTMFLGGAIGGGLLLPLLILAFPVLAGSSAPGLVLFLAALLIVGGAFALRDSLIKAGVTTPVL